MRALRQDLPSADIGLGRQENFPKCRGQTYIFGYGFGLFRFGIGYDSGAGRVCRDIVNGGWVVEVDPKYRHMQDKESTSPTHN